MAEIKFEDDILTGLDGKVIIVTGMFYLTLTYQHVLTNGVQVLAVG
jgi:hypothetical protein